jgi:hypothetical protein
MGAEDWLATLGALVAIGVTTGMLHVVLSHVLPGFSSNPPFLEMQPPANRHAPCYCQSARI